MSIPNKTGLLHAKEVLVELEDMILLLQTGCGKPSITLLHDVRRFSLGTASLQAGTRTLPEKGDKRCS